ncbi:AsmA family protein [uncultured Mucilaginibacter sp.]|uniref:AsmA family protein n=1 Tax=uncultured Mucilaginibacter sp. TaxID=797541 RepID=UPI0025DF0BB7|nr:AsmA family protein [uncultured Mucilaginibacter sp.]
MPKWLKIILKVIAGVVLLFVLLSVGLFIYINSNKAKVLSLITSTLNKNLDGNLAIGDMETTFFKGFPGISVSLKNVTIKDKRWAEHKHTLLSAKDFDVSINTAALLRGTIRISNIGINNAAIELYKDSTGYSNTSVFKKKKSAPKTNKPDDDSGSSAEFGKFSLSNVSFAVNNQANNKLFSFDINKLSGKMAYPDSGWRAALQLDVMARSLAFNTKKGSFIKDKLISGQMMAGFNNETDKIFISSKGLKIGYDIFQLNAMFDTGKKETAFAIHLIVNQIMWRSASLLLADNIKKTLDKFNLAKPIDLKTTIAGSLGEGDPYLHVAGTIRNNTLIIPGGQIDSCNFNAVFTNEVEKGKGFNDANSAIRLFKFTGRYNHLPFLIDTGSIINLEKPIATGNFKSNFPLANFNYMLDDIAKFSKGTANMDLHYKADIVNYRLNKPVIAGVINFRNADAIYLPRNLAFKNTSLSLNFVKNDLILNNIRVQSGHSVVMMNGRVNNFLNFYYDAPEKMLLTWNIKSPELRLAEFLGFLGTRKQVQTRTVRRGSGNSGNIIDQLGNVLDKGNVEMHMEVAKVYYKKFLATDVRANLLTTGDGIIIKDVGLKHANGALRLNGKLMQGNNLNNFNINTTVSSVDIRQFFYSFDNFGIKDITYENLKGYLSAKANISGGIKDNGSLVPRSIHGTTYVSLRNSALLNYQPLIKVGKFAFPFRDLKNIEIPKLDAKFDIQGDKIIINPMQLNSSVLNADIAGVYGLTKGTNIAFDVPLRNPKKDAEITDKEELKKRRYRGIVLHLAAKEDETGKVKIGFNKDRKKD